MLGGNMSKKKKVNKVANEGGISAFYCVGAIGAAVYFVQNSDGFWNFILALLKAAVWPAFVVHRALELLSL